MNSSIKCINRFEWHRLAKGKAFLIAVYSLIIVFGTMIFIGYGAVPVFVDVTIPQYNIDCTCPSGVDNRCGKRFSRQQGELPYGYDHKYVYGRLGYNLKITDMQASIGCAQLEKLPDFIEKMTSAKGGEKP